jgi:hypothetical protein
MPWRWLICVRVWNRPHQNRADNFIKNIYIYKTLRTGLIITALPRPTSTIHHPPASRTARPPAMHHLHIPQIQQLNSQQALDSLGLSASAMAGPRQGTRGTPKKNDEPRRGWLVPRRPKSTRAGQFFSSFLWRF